MKVCVLQPDYSESNLDYKNYDPPRNLSALLPEATVDHLFLNKRHTYRQLMESKKQRYDVYVNLCEGYQDWDVPCIDVVYSLESLNLPYTGPNATLFEPPKTLMKYVAYTAGVRTPDYVVIKSLDDLTLVQSQLTFPLFLKPSKAGDSLGIDDNSHVSNLSELHNKAESLLNNFDEVLAEEYIHGREFTVLLAANPAQTCTVYDPVEFVFPEGRSFKTYALKTSELHPKANIPCSDPELKQQLKNASRDIFSAFGGVGYARLDYRLNDEGELFFLEINFGCSVFYDQGYEGSADYILNYDKDGKEGFLRRIINEGISRHNEKQKKYYVSGNSIAGYGIYAGRNLKAGEIIFKSEERAKEIVTRRHVEKYWTEAQKEVFRRYAYPLSSEVYVLWSTDPREWAPQNHCCSPNTHFRGLDVVTLKDVSKDEELTIDYASFLDESMEPFKCSCGSINCREFIKGTRGNSVTIREQEQAGISYQL